MVDADRDFNFKVRLFIVLALMIFGINAFAEEGARPAADDLAVAAKSHLMKFLISVGDASDFREKSDWNELMEKISPQVSERVAKNQFASGTPEEFKASLADMMLVQVEGFAISLLGSERMIVEKTDSLGANQASYQIRPYQAQSAHTYEVKCTRSIDKGFFGPREERSCKIERIMKGESVPTNEEA